MNSKCVLIFKVTHNAIKKSHKERDNKNIGEHHAEQTEKDIANNFH